MDRFWQDLRYGFRLLIKSPGFSIVAILSLALGIGANTAIFSLISGFLLTPLPVDQPRQLVTIFTADKKNPGNLPVSHYNYNDYRDKGDAFSGVIAYTFGGASMKSGDKTEPVNYEIASGNYFDVLGVKAARGRTFLPEEDKTPGANPVAVISDGLWH